MFQIFVNHLFVGWVKGNFATLVGWADITFQFDNIYCPGIGRDATDGSYYGFYIAAPGATGKISGTFGRSSTQQTTGVQVLSVGQLAIHDSDFIGLTYSADVETSTDPVSLTGCTSTGTITSDVATGLSSPPGVTFANWTVGDVVTVVVTSTAIAGGSASVTYTVQDGDNSASIANGIVAAMNVSAPILTAGFVSWHPVDGQGGLFVIGVPGATCALSGSSTGTTTVIPYTYNTSTSPRMLALSGNRFRHPMVPYITLVPTEGSTVTMLNLWGPSVTARLEPAGALNAATVVLPAAPDDGQRVRIASTATIAALTIQVNSTPVLVGGSRVSQTILGFGTSYTVPVSLGQGHELEWSDADAGWLVLY